MRSRWTIGTKHTGYVKLSEMTDDPSARAEDLVKVGDELDLVVEKTNDQEGSVYLSKKKLESRKGLEEIAKAAEEGTVMEGVVTEANKGGVVVLVKGVKVFVPRSQATMRRDEDYTQLVKQNVKLVITSVPAARSWAASTRSPPEANAAKREAFWANVEVGQTYTGVVKSLTSYGAFVDRGRRGRPVPHQRAELEPHQAPQRSGQRGRHHRGVREGSGPREQEGSLGYKKAEDNPWEKLRNEYPIGSVFTAPVVSITKFGAFVRILPGVDGLVHISEISNERVEKVGDVLKVGDEVNVKLLDVDFDKKRISLS